MSNRIRVPQELWDELDKPRRTKYGSFKGPGICWSRRRLWPEEGPHELTKAELQVAQSAQWKLYEEEVERECAAAKERCKHMTVQEAWNKIQSHLNTNEYEVEAISEADWIVYHHAKDLITQLVKLY